MSASFQNLLVLIRILHLKLLLRNFNSFKILEVQGAYVARKISPEITTLVDCWLFCVALLFKKKTGQRRALMKLCVTLLDIVVRID